jgi:predicted AAA+ superfamily ATPase
MGKIIKRLFSLNLPKNKSAFLWGPRKSGKTYWIKEHLSGTKVIDLLKTDEFADYVSRPALLRERFQNFEGRIVIDEVQKVPALLDEVHWLMENSKLSFLLTGSSARKLKRGHANLLGGRAWKRQMTPLSRFEVDRFDLESVMVSGLLPPHYLSPQPIEDLRAYIADYLKEEIAAEALTQNIPAFSTFLRVAALTSSELLNYTNVASDTGVSARVVRTYFDILEDTYLGFRVQPWTKSKNRRMIETEKFYLFDVGVANYLAQRQPKQGTFEFGKSFEHYILMELMAYKAYRQPELEITFWRTAGDQEVDFILNDKVTAIEIKSGNVHSQDIKGMVALCDDGAIKNKIVVSLEKEPRVVGNNIRILPWGLFLEKLWGDELI